MNLRHTAASSSSRNPPTLLQVLFLHSSYNFPKSYSINPKKPKNNFHLFSQNHDLQLHSLSSLTHALPLGKIQSLNATRY
jgi:hypothetical protein